MQRFVALFGIISLWCCFQGCIQAPKEKSPFPPKDREEAKKLLIGKWEEVQEEKPVAFDFMDDGKVLYITHKLAKKEKKSVKFDVRKGTYEVEGEGQNTLVMEFKIETPPMSLPLYPFTVSEDELVFYRSGIPRAEKLTHFKRVKDFSPVFKEALK